MGYSGELLNDKNFEKSIINISQQYFSTALKVSGLRKMAGRKHLHFELIVLIELNRTRGCILLGNIRRKLFHVVVLDLFKLSC